MGERMGEKKEGTRKRENEVGDKKGREEKPEGKILTLDERGKCHIIYRDPKREKCREIIKKKEKKIEREYKVIYHFPSFNKQTS